MEQPTKAPTGAYRKFAYIESHLRDAKRGDLYIEDGKVIFSQKDETQVFCRLDEIKAIYIKRFVTIQTTSGQVFVLAPEGISVKPSFWWYVNAVISFVNPLDLFTLEPKKYTIVLDTWRDYAASLGVKVINRPLFRFSWWYTIQAAIFFGILVLIALVFITYMNK